MHENVHISENVIADKDFIWELCKRGHVHVYSSQVSVMGIPSLGLTGITIPPGVQVEYVGCKPGKYESDTSVSVTFRWP